MDKQRGKRKNLVKLTWILTWTFFCAKHGNETEIAKHCNFKTQKKVSVGQCFIHYLHIEWQHMTYSTEIKYAKSLNAVVGRSHFHMQNNFAPTHPKLRSGTIVDTQTLLLGLLVARQTYFGDTIILNRAVRMFFNYSAVSFLLNHFKNIVFNFKIIVNVVVFVLSSESRRSFWGNYERISNMIISRSNLDGLVLFAFREYFVNLFCCFFLLNSICWHGTTESINGSAGMSALRFTFFN